MGHTLFYRQDSILGGIWIKLQISGDHLWYRRMQSCRWEANHWPYSNIHSGNLKTNVTTVFLVSTYLLQEALDVAELVCVACNTSCIYVIPKWLITAVILRHWWVVELHFLIDFSIRVRFAMLCLIMCSKGDNQLVNTFHQSSWLHNHSFSQGIPFQYGPLSKVHCFICSH